MEYIGDRIKQIRLDSGLTQTEFGKKIGLQKASLSALEVGKNKPSGATLKSIINEFCVNEAWLEAGEGERYDQNRIKTKELLEGELLFTSAIISQSLLDLLANLKDKDVEEALEIETSIQALAALLEDPGINRELYIDYYEAISSVLLDLQRYIGLLKTQQKMGNTAGSRHLHSIIKSIEAISELYNVQIESSGGNWENDRAKLSGSLKNFGSRLKQAISESPFSHNKLAKILQLDNETIAAWLKEKTYPDAKMLLKLCGLLNKSPSWLLLGTEYTGALPDSDLLPLNDAEAEMLRQYRCLDDGNRLEAREIIKMKYDRLIKRGTLPGSAGGNEEDAKKHA